MKKDEKPHFELEVTTEIAVRPCTDESCTRDDDSADDSAGPSVGYTRSYAAVWDRVFGDKGKAN